MYLGLVYWLFFIYDGEGVNDVCSLFKRDFLFFF